MHRRSFVASIGIAMASAVTGLKPTMAGTDPAIQWDLFTDPGCSRYDLSKPFQIGDRIFASDGRILASVPGAVLDSSEHGKVPNLSDLPWDQLGDRHWFDESRIAKTPARFQACETCFGRGRVGDATPCPCECMGYCVDCNDTGWTSGEKCPYCNGHPFIEGGFDCQVNGAKFCAAKVAIAKTLGDVQFKVVSASPIDMRILAFRFAGNGLGFIAEKE